MKTLQTLLKREREREREQDYVMATVEKMVAAKRRDSSRYQFEPLAEKPCYLQMHLEHSGGTPSVIA